MDGNAWRRLRKYLFCSMHLKLITDMTQDSDYATRTPRKPFGGIAPYGTVGGPAGSGMIGDLAAAGTPSNLGEIGDTGLFLFFTSRLIHILTCILKSFG
jgi:hypothetical protein